MPENDSLQTQPRLPPELECVIFMMATSDANDSGDEMRIHAARLTRVAKRVQEWIRPVLYSIFVQGLFLNLVDTTFPKFYNDPDLLKRVAGLAKHLFIGHHVSDQSVIVLLRHCVNVRDIAIRRDYAEPFQGDKKDNYLHYLCASPTLHGVRRLFLTIRLKQDDLESIQMAEAFKALTHLDIIFPNWKDYDPRRNLARILSGFTKLTHLAITVIPSSKTLEAPTISGILSSCAHLEIFIIKAHFDPTSLWNPCTKFKRVGFDTDPRWELKSLEQVVQLEAAMESVGASDSEDWRIVLMFTSTKNMNVMREWEKGARGLVDMWEVAARYTEARRRGFFVNNSLNWINFTSGEPFSDMELLTSEGREWYSSLAR